MNNNKAVFYDTQSCIKCFACVLGCAVENRQRLQRDFNYGVEKSMIESHDYLNYLTVETKEVGTFPDVLNIAAFKHCQHCEHPKCVDVCPTYALIKEDNGAVTLDQSKCVGCRACIDVCPYDVPKFSPVTGKTYKCTMCNDRLEADLPTACSAACPSVAIVSGNRDEVVAEARKRAAHYSEVFNKKYIVYGDEPVNGVGQLAYMTIAPVDNRDDYLLPENPSTAVATTKKVASVLGIASVAATAGAVAIHGVYSSIKLPKSEMGHHDHNDEHEGGSK